MAAIKSITEDDLRDIFRALVEKAKRGDERAIKTIMSYLQPPPPQAAPVLNQINVRNNKATPGKQPSRLIENNGAGLAAEE